MAKKKVFKLDPVWFGQVWRGMTADQRNYIRDCHQLSGKVLFRLWNSDAPSKWDAITGPTWEPDTAYWPYSDELWAAIQVYNYDHNMNKLHEVLFMTKKHPVLDPARKGTPWGEMTDEERLYIRARDAADGGTMVWQADGRWAMNGIPGWVKACKYWPVNKEEFKLDPARKGTPWALMSQAERAEIQLAYNRALETVLVLSVDGHWVRFNSPDRCGYRSYWPCDKPEPKPEPAYKAEYAPLRKMGSCLVLNHKDAGAAVCGQSGPNGTTVAGFVQTEKLAQQMVEHWRQHGSLVGSNCERLLHGSPLFEGKLRQPWAVCTEIPDDAFPTKKETVP